MSLDSPSHTTEQPPEKHAPAASVPTEAPEKRELTPAQRDLTTRFEATERRRTVSPEKRDAVRSGKITDQVHVQRLLDAGVIKHDDALLDTDPARLSSMPLETLSQGNHVVRDAMTKQVDQTFRSIRCGTMEEAHGLVRGSLIGTMESLTSALKFRKALGNAPQLTDAVRMAATALREELDAPSSRGARMNLVQALSDPALLSRVLDAHLLSPAKLGDFLAETIRDGSARVRPETLAAFVDRGIITRESALTLAEQLPSA